MGVFLTSSLKIKTPDSVLNVWGKGELLKFCIRNFLVGLGSHAPFFSPVFSTVTRKYANASEISQFSRPCN